MGHEVVVLDDLSGGFRDQVTDGALFAEGSITDDALVERLFAEHRFDYVYHIAAYAAEGLSHFIRRFNYSNNIIGSATLINAAVRHDVKCFVFTSSIATYGAAQVPMREDMTPHPEDPYGIAKYAVELDLDAAHRQFGLNFVIFRPHNVYGEHQNIGDRYRNVIGIFLAQMLRGEPLAIFGDGEQQRAFSHIDDVAPHIARSVDVPAARGQAINIGADEPCSIIRLVELVGREFGITPKVTHLPPRNEVVHAWSDHDRARRLLGVQPLVGLEDGLHQMAEWARRVGVRSSPGAPPIEVDKGVPWTAGG